LDAARRRTDRNRLDRGARLAAQRKGPAMTIQLEDRKSYTLTATCPSRIGTVAAVSTFLATRRCFITEMQQFDDVITERFFVRTTFYADPQATPSHAELREQFVEVAQREQMDWEMHDTSVRMRVLLLVSKFDHCLDDLLYRRRTGELAMDITAVVSNHPDLKPMADAHGIEFVHLPVSGDNKAEQEARLLQIVVQTRSDLIVLARYMQILSDDLCRKLRGRAINIHHSFLPGFKGARPYHQAHARGVKLIGATAHYVTAELDEGPIIEQVVERVDHSYTPEKLAAVGRDSECVALARAVRFHVEHRVFMNADKTTVVFR
jgi:formyltetrahydrofolate deformylase